MSTGIGPDNIDIVMNELDALVNIDLKKRVEKEEHTTLTLFASELPAPYKPIFRLTVLC